jgi:RHS repeat-associated protein
MLDANNNITAQFVYGDLSRNEPDFAIRGGNWYRMATDQVGPLIGVLHPRSGTPYQSVQYDPWGGVTSDSFSYAPLGFAGGLYDEDTKLVHFGARDYDPSVGRWIFKDPILLNGGQENLYVYAGNELVNGRDPNGLTTYLCGRLIGQPPGTISGGNCFQKWIRHHDYVCVDGFCHGWERTE